MPAHCAEESIYNLLPRLEEKPVKPPRYISMFRPAVKREAEKNKAPCKTMGPAKVALPSPKDFLQKRSKLPKLPARKKEQDSQKLPELSVPRRTDHAVKGIQKLPELSVPPRTDHPVMGIQKLPELSVPRRTNHPVMGSQSKKNFINANAIAVITGPPKKPQPICVDRRQGDKYLLETSGLVPKYIKKKDYGVTPKYLTRRNEEMKRAQEEYEASTLEHLKEKAMKQLPDEERESILQGLKKNWEEVHREYQSLPLKIDTIGMKLYQGKLESQLRQLERDIDVIEKHKVIYIANE